MGEVVALSANDPVPGEANPKIVARLELMLEQARAGEIIGLGVAVVLTGGAQATWWSGHTWESVAAAIGTLNYRVFARDD